MPFYRGPTFSYVQISRFLFRLQISKQKQTHVLISSVKIFFFSSDFVNFSFKKRIIASLLSSMNRSKSSPFSKAEEIFIVEQFAILESPIKVKRAFRLKFKNTRSTREITGIHLYSFTRIRDLFMKNGVAKSSHSQHVRGVDKTDPDKVKRIENHFIQFPFCFRHLWN